MTHPAIKGSLVARSQSELKLMLTTWGSSAPPRLERRGKQDELERHTFNRFLSCMVKADRLSFPLSVDEDENPDFFLFLGGNRIGIEVTEAVNPREQAEWTRRDRENPDGLYPLNLMDPERPSRVQQMLRTAISVKTEKCSQVTDELLVYLNTNDISFDLQQLGPAAVLDTFQPARPDHSRFNKIWIFESGGLFELLKGEFISDLHDEW